MIMTKKELKKCQKIIDSVNVEELRSKAFSADDWIKINNVKRELYNFSKEEHRMAEEAVIDCYKRIEKGTDKRLKCK